MLWNMYTLFCDYIIRSYWLIWSFYPYVSGSLHCGNRMTAPKVVKHDKTPLIARFMGPTWGPSGADRTQVGPMLAHKFCYLGQLNMDYAQSQPQQNHNCVHNSVKYAVCNDNTINTIQWITGNGCGIQALQRTHINSFRTTWGTFIGSWITKTLT